jgi:hypothetical protein
MGPKRDYRLWFVVIAGCLILAGVIMAPHLFALLGPADPTAPLDLDQENAAVRQLERIGAAALVIAVIVFGLWAFLVDR